MNIDAICDAVDTVLSFNEKRRKGLLFELPLKEKKLRHLQEFMAMIERSHKDILAAADLEDDIEAITNLLAHWPSLKREAFENMEAVVGLGARRTVSPQVHALVQQLLKVQRKQADGVMRPLSLSYIALACGLSEGTVCKLKSGTYPVSAFPPTVKRGRRAAKR